MRLHNYCIDMDVSHSPDSVNGRVDGRDLPGYGDEAHIQRRTRQQRGKYNRQAHRAINLDAAGSPSDLVGSGHHFPDEPGGTGRRPTPNIDRYRVETPMREMLRQIADQNLSRPDINMS